jgi:antitoxin (DNA-binding transcriptional repressor) of toxin-antitoxin stability system
MGQASASVRELKSKLSHYLRLTKAGESVVITERGVPIGRIAAGRTHRITLTCQPAALASSDAWSYIVAA